MEIFGTRVDGTPGEVWRTTLTRTDGTASAVVWERGRRVVNRLGIASERIARYSEG